MFLISDNYFCKIWSCYAFVVFPRKFQILKDLHRLYDPIIQNGVALGGHDPLIELYIVDK